MNKKIHIPAIHDNNLKKILDDLGLSKAIDQHQQNCINCGDVITWDNIAGLKVLRGEVRVICTNPECLATLTNQTPQDNG